MTKFIIALLVLAISFGLAQAPDTLWTKTYGWGGDDLGFGIENTIDTGFIIVGSTQGPATKDYDIFLLKTDSKGDTAWTRLIGGSSAENGYDVHQTPDSGYIIAGRTQSFGAGNYDAYLIKTDKNGDTMWTRTYGGVGDDYGYCLVQTSDSFYLLVGQTCSFGSNTGDIYAVKVKYTGDTAWTKHYGGGDAEIAWSAIENSGGGYMILGWQETPAGDYDIYLLNIDTNGDTIWTRTYGGSGNDFGYSIKQTFDGYIIAGLTSPIITPNNDIFLLKIYDNGDSAWIKTYGGAGEEQCWGVELTSDQGYIVVGYSNSYGAGDHDIFLIKTDADGNTIWAKTCGGPQDEKGHEVRQTIDDRYVIVGNTLSFGAGASDVYITKTGFYVDTCWTNTYGGPGDDRGYAVRTTTSGSYIIAGSTTSNGRDDDSADVYLVLADSSGGCVWTRSWGGPGNDRGNSIYKTSDGGYIIAGYTNSFGAGQYDAYLIKTDGSGDSVWTKTYGKAGDDAGNAVCQTADGGYIIAGYTAPALNRDVFLIKTLANGDTAWTRTFGGSGDDEGYSVFRTADGGYIIAGYTTLASDRDVYLIKTDAGGNIGWTKTYGSVGNDAGTAVYQTTDGGYIITGYTTPSADREIYLIKTDSNGDSVWTRIFGGKGDDCGYGVFQNVDGGYIIAGASNSYGAGDYDVYLLRTDENGGLLSTDLYGSVNDDFGHSLHQTEDGGYIIAGYTNSFTGGDNDVFLIKTEPLGAIGIETKPVPTYINPSLVYAAPNPFRRRTVISYSVSQISQVRVTLYNILGQEVKSVANTISEPGLHQLVWEGTDKKGNRLANGVYFLSVIVHPEGQKGYTHINKLIMVR